MKKHSAGFTLIEILVVLLIISIVTSVALLNINRNENKQMESFANELTQILTLAEEQAMLQPNVLGLSLNDNSFHFASLQPGAEKKNIWTPVQDTILGKHNIPSNIQLNVKVGGTTSAAFNEETKNIPQIIISTDGDITPFTIYVGKKGERPRYVVIGDADGHITSKLLT
jgi:general secretion pathway protein H